MFGILPARAGDDNGPAANEDCGNLTLRPRRAGVLLFRSHAAVMALS